MFMCMCYPLPTPRPLLINPSPGVHRAAWLGLGLGLGLALTLTLTLALTLALTLTSGVRRAARGRDEAARPPRAGRRPRYISLYLPISRYISLYLAISHYISPAHAPRADQQPGRRARPSHGAVDLKPVSSTARWDEISAELDDEMGRDRLRSISTEIKRGQRRARPSSRARWRDRPSPVFCLAPS